MAQKILGLDIGAHSVKAVVLEGTVRGWELAARAEAPLGTPPAPPAPAPAEAEGEQAADATTEQKTETAPTPPAAANGDDDGPEPDPRLAAALGAIAERIGGLKADQVIVSLPGTSAASPLVTLPFTDTRKIDATLGFEVEGLLPFDVDDALYDYQVLSQEDGQSDLLVGVVRRDDFAELLETLQALGVDPRVITLPGLALERLAVEAAQTTGLAGDACAAVLDIGHNRGVLSVVRGAADEKSTPSLVFTRTFAVGTSSLRLSEDGGEDEAHLRRSLQPLVREIRQSIRAAQTRDQGTVGQLWIAGGLAARPGVAAALASQLGLPVEVVALPGDAGAKIPAEEQPVYAQAVGLGLRAMVRGKHLNLRKGDFAFKGDLDYLKGKTSRLVAFAAILLLLFAGTFQARLHTVQTREARLDEALCETTARVLGSCETDFNVAISKLQGGGSHTAQIPTASAMEVFTETISRMPTEVGLDLEEVEVTLDRLRLKGKVDSFDGVDQVVAGLRQSLCIGDIRRGRVQRTKDEKIDFSLDALYVCGQNAGNATAGVGG